MGRRFAAFPLYRNNMRAVMMKYRGATVASRVDLLS